MTSDLLLFSLMFSNTFYFSLLIIIGFFVYKNIIVSLEKNYWTIIKNKNEDNNFQDPTTVHRLVDFFVLEDFCFSFQDIYSFKNINIWKNIKHC